MDINVKNRMKDAFTSPFSDFKNSDGESLNDINAGAYWFFGDLTAFNKGTSFYVDSISEESSEPYEHSFIPYVNNGDLFVNTYWIKPKKINNYQYWNGNIKDDIKGIDFGSMCSFDYKFYTNYGETYADRRYSYCFIDRINNKKTIRIRWSNNPSEGVSVQLTNEYNFDIEISTIVVRLQAGGGQASAMNWNTNGNGGGSGAAANIVLDFDYDSNLSCFRVYIPWTSKNTAGESNGNDAEDISLYFNRIINPGWSLLATIGGGSGGKFGNNSEAGKGGSCSFDTNCLNKYFYVLNSCDGMDGKTQKECNKTHISITMKIDKDEHPIYFDHDNQLTTPSWFISTIDGATIKFTYGDTCRHFGVGAPSPYGESASWGAATGSSWAGKAGSRGSGGHGPEANTGSSEPGGQGGQPFIELYF